MRKSELTSLLFGCGLCLLILAVGCATNPPGPPVIVPLDLQILPSANEDQLLQRILPKLEQAGASPSAGDTAAVALMATLSQPQLQGASVTGNPRCFGGSGKYDQIEKDLKEQFMKTEDMKARRDILMKWPARGCTLDVAYTALPDLIAFDHRTIDPPAFSFSQWPGAKGRSNPRWGTANGERRIVATWFFIHPAKYPFGGISHDLIMETMGRKGRP